jgi:anti-anti-sigma factor
VSAGFPGIPIVPAYYVANNRQLTIPSIYGRLICGFPSGEQDVTPHIVRNGYCMAIELTVYLSGTTSILRVSGSVSETEVYRFSQAIRDLMQQQAARIAIDISKIDFMESHALGILVSHFLAMQRQGREMVLINTNGDPSAYMTRLLETTRLNEIIRIINPATHA